MLIYFLKRQLPWQDVKAKDKNEKYKNLWKLRLFPAILCENLSCNLLNLDKFVNYFKYVKELQSYEKPN